MDSQRITPTAYPTATTHDASLKPGMAPATYNSSATPMDDTSKQTKHGMGGKISGMIHKIVDPLTGHHSDRAAGEDGSRDTQRVGNYEETGTMDQGLMPPGEHEANLSRFTKHDSYLSSTVPTGNVYITSSTQPENGKARATVTEVKTVPIYTEQVKVIPAHEEAFQTTKIIPAQQVEVQTMKVIPEKQVPVTVMRTIPQQEVPVTEMKTILEKRIPVTEMRTVPEKHIPIQVEKDLQEIVTVTTTQKTATSITSNNGLHK